MVGDTDVNWEIQVRSPTPGYGWLPHGGIGRSTLARVLAQAAASRSRRVLTIGWRAINIVTGRVVMLP